mmetsp:Transcript_12952/g.36740  ORF Transcript_12952/g.36740 Transcript_12952/m.36740 type:complete len:320 (+) Transcript_12952:532-1491(+)
MPAVHGLDGLRRLQHDPLEPSESPAGDRPVQGLQRAGGVRPVRGLQPVLQGLVPGRRGRQREPGPRRQALHHRHMGSLDQQARGRGAGRERRLPLRVPDGGDPHRAVPAHDGGEHRLLLLPRVQARRHGDTDRGPQGVQGGAHVAGRRPRGGLEGGNPHAHQLLGRPCRRLPARGLEGRGLRQEPGARGAARGPGAVPAPLLRHRVLERLQDDHHVPGPRPARGVRVHREVRRVGAGVLPVLPGRRRGAAHLPGGPQRRPGLAGPRPGPPGEVEHVLGHRCAGGERQHQAFGQGRSHHRVCDPQQHQQAKQKMGERQRT